jgi:hypothetical protein
MNPRVSRMPIAAMAGHTSLGGLWMRVTPATEARARIPRPAIRTRVTAVIGPKSRTAYFRAK